MKLKKLKKNDRLGVEKKTIENKGCFSDSELEEREKNQSNLKEGKK